MDRPLSSRARPALWSTWLASRTLGAFSRRIGGVFAGHLWLTPWQVEAEGTARRREQAWLETTHPLRSEVGDARLHGWTVGDDPTVLLVHGWGDRAASLGAVIDPLTSSGLRVVGVDLPGHGASPPGATDLYSLAAAVRRPRDSATRVSYCQTGQYVTEAPFASGF